MKTFRLFFTILFLLTFYVTRAQNNYPDTTLNSIDPVKAEKAKALVRDYIRILLKGDNLDSLVNICSIPFSWDRKRIIYNWSDFKASQQSIIEDKGKNRKFIIDTIFIRRVRSEILDAVIPVNVYYVLVKIKVPEEIKDGTSGILFAVQITEDPKIIGFSD